MNDSSTSLDRLHDLTVPPEISWWPLAPGWIVLLAILLLVVIRLSWRVWKRWRSNAYRREALRELAIARDATAIAEILRRAALVIVPRQEIAQLNDSGWLDWLAAHYPDAVPEEIRSQLASGIYRQDSTTHNPDSLRQFASQWITRHF